MLVKSKIKYIQSLGQKKFRDEEGLFIAEGPKIIQELLGTENVIIENIYALPEWAESNKQVTGNTSVITITEIELGKISQLITPNKVLAVILQFETPLEIITKNKITIVLDSIQDPGNMGTIIRIADWFGVSQIVCSNDCADMYNTKVVQSTMGSIARVKMMYTSLKEWLSTQTDIEIYGTTLNGNSIQDIIKIKEGIIVFGNESKGISQDVQQYCTNKITIPKKGKAESLNAGVAAGIVLSHIIN